MSSAEINPLDQYEQDKIREYLENLRANPLREARAQEIVENWVKDGALLSREAGKEIGLLYIKEILGLDPERARWSEIQDHLAGIKADKKHIRTFWSGVNKIAPTLVQDQDLEYIISANEMGPDVGFDMIGYIVLGPRGYHHTLLSKLFYGAPK